MPLIGANPENLDRLPLVGSRRAIKLIEDLAVIAVMTVDPLIAFRNVGLVDDHGYSPPDISFFLMEASIASASARTDRAWVVAGRPPAKRAQGLVIGEIVRFHVAYALWDADAKAVDITRLEPLARLGGSLFAGVGAFVSRSRPA